MQQTAGIIILAAGKRALDEQTTPHRPKLLEDVTGKPVLHHVINSVRSIKKVTVSGITIVISDRFENILCESLRSFPDLQIAVQESHRGTADAVWCAIEQDMYPNSDNLFVLMGDQPLITSQDLEEFYQQHSAHASIRASILTFREDRNKREFRKCAKVIRRWGEKFLALKTRCRIISTPEELHVGPYLFEASWLRGILTVLSPRVAHYEDEFHLYIALEAARADTGVHICSSNHPENFLGVDTTDALNEVRRRMSERQ